MDKIVQHIIIIKNEEGLYSIAAYGETEQDREEVEEDVKLIEEVLDLKELEEDG